MSVGQIHARRARTALLIIVALAAVLRFVTLDQQSLESDEIVTRWLMLQDFDQMLGSVTSTEQTPLLFYVLAWPLGHLEPSAVGLRLISAIAGVATVPLAYKAAQELLSTRAGLLAAGLTATNPLLIWFSQEARSYALAVALSSAALVFFVRALRDGERRDIALWAVLSALALSTHYFAAFVAAPQALWLVVNRPTRRTALTATGLLALVSAADLVLALEQRCGGSDFSRQDLMSRIARLPKHDLMGFTIEYGRPEILLASAGVALGLVLVGITLFKLDGAGRLRAWPVASVVVVALAVAILLAIAGVDYFNTRNLLVTLVPTLVVVAVACAAPGSGRLGVAAGVALCAVFLGAVGVVTFDPRWQREDWRDLAAALGPRGARVVVVTPGSGPLPLQAYVRGAGHMPADGFRTREIVLAALPVVSSEIRVRPPLPSSAPSPPPPAHGFVLAERRQTSSYVLLRYIASRPVRVTRRALERTALDSSQPASVIVQRRSGPDEAVPLACERYRR